MAERNRFNLPDSYVHNDVEVSMLILESSSFFYVQLSNN